MTLLRFVKKYRSFITEMASICLLLTSACFCCFGPLSVHRMIVKLIVTISLFNFVILLAKHSVPLCITCCWLLIVGCVLSEPLLMNDILAWSTTLNTDQTTNADYSNAGVQFISDVKPKSTNANPNVERDDDGSPGDLCWTTCNWGFDKRPLVPRCVDTALQQLCEACLSRYLRSWHDPACDCVTLTNEIRRLIRHVVVVLYDRVVSVDWSSTVVDQLAPVLAIHVADCLDSDDGNRPGTNGIHPALKSAADERRHLRAWALVLCRACFSDFDQWSEPACVFVRELVAFGLLQPLVEVSTDANLLTEFLTSSLGGKHSSRRSVQQPGRENANGGDDDQADGSSDSSAATTPLLFRFACGSDEWPGERFGLADALAEPATLFAFVNYLKHERADLAPVRFLCSTNEILVKLRKGDVERLARARNELHQLCDQHDDQLRSTVGEAGVAVLRSALETSDPASFGRLAAGPLETAHAGTLRMLERRHETAFRQSSFYFQAVFSPETGEIMDESLDGEQGDEEKAERRLENQQPHEEIHVHIDEDQDEDEDDDNDKDNDKDDLLLNNKNSDNNSGSSRRHLSGWKVAVARVEPRREVNSGRTIYVYVVEVEDEMQDRWTVDRRYGDFYALESKLVEFHGDQLLKPFPLPAKKTFGGRASRTFVASRRPDFDQFLKRLLANPLLKGSQLLLAFLSVRGQWTPSVARPFDVIRKMPSVVKLSRERGQNLTGFLKNFAPTNTSSSNTRRTFCVKSSVTVPGPTPSVSTSPIPPVTTSVALKLLKVPFKWSIDVIFFTLYRILDFGAPAAALGLVIRRFWPALVDSFVKGRLSRYLKDASRAGRVAHLLNRLTEALVTDDVTGVVGQHCPRDFGAVDEAHTMMALLRPLFGFDLQPQLERCLRSPTLIKRIVYVLIDSLFARLFPEADSVTKQSSPVVFMEKKRQ
ncbi:Sorting nexin-14 [Trichinella britovi]|uniref:Sorting nexin-14 n=2 Tax=Trichinella britovi TaxID=45882 RepID=A0A0V1CJM0_TRIBR|nr:Sorting nexin-14 [Trichinella britovi]